MKTAPTWFSTIARCPHCNKTQEVAHVFEDEHKPLLWTCIYCEGEFNYWNPNNPLGHTISNEKQKRLRCDDCDGPECESCGGAPDEKEEE